MKLNNSTHKTSLQILVASLPFLFTVIFIFKDYIIKLMYLFPACPFFKTFDLYCPGCGNTRSVFSILNGDILSSLRYNITPLLLMFFAIMAYIEFILNSFGRRIHILPRNTRFYLITAIILALYSIVRNFFPYLTP